MVAMSTAVAEPAIYDKVEDTGLVRRYDDGPGWPNASPEKERAYRRGFLEEARRVVRDWPGHPEQIRQQEAQAEAAWQLRRRVRRRYTVYGPGYGPGCAGRRTYHLGYRPGHEAPAARLRGRHHSLAFVLQDWDESASMKMYETIVLPAWLTAVEQWASGPIRPRVIKPPPRPGDIEPGLLRTVRSEDDDSDSSSEPAPPLGNSPSEPSPAMHSQSCPPPQPRRLQLTRAADIEIRPPDWLLRGMLERDSFALVFGDPGCGKSFLAIDWACRIATGTPWRGHAVSSSPVVYIAREGQQGFGRRIRAWEEHNGISLADAPLYVAPAVAIPEMSQLTELVMALESLGEPPALIVLDTLARCFGGGDENSTQDMSRFVSACDAIRRHYHCTILVVHHTGHADKNRARGAIALKAALDAEYRLAKDEKLLLTATKMKDAETPAPVAMGLATVDLPGVVDDYGNPVTSAAIEVLDADTGAIVSKAMATMSGKRGKWQKVGLEVARRLIATGDDGQASVKDWHSECEAAGMRQSTRYDVLAKLHERGEVIVDGDTIVPA